MRIGVIGLGIMGAPMARNLLRAGHDVVVHTRTPGPRLDAVLAAGATQAGSPADVSAAVEAVVTMLPDSPDVDVVVAGPRGVLAGGWPGLLAIDMSTIAPAVARRLAAAAAERGVTMLDAPVSGGEQGAIAGTLSIMVGGDADGFRRAGPIFAALGRQAVHMGGPGQGQMAKLVNQVVGAVTLAAVAEGTMLARSAGLDPEDWIRAVGAGAAASWMLTEQAPRMQRRDFAPGFMVRLQQKDLRIALHTAREMGVHLPAAALVHELFAAVEVAGGGALGTQALVTALERLAGRPTGLP
jgi:3-hydroxyisobutyrate dehydrogenase-like beta-hydroxyacid dehydrogenase